MKNLISVLSVCLVISAYGQNLVPNPSFELYDTCPSTASQIQFATNWFNPSWGSSDYYNSCFITGAVNVDVPANVLGFQYAHTGQAYAGIFCAYPWPTIPCYREYVESKLNDSLQAGITYYVSIWVSLSDSSWYATDDIAISFSDDSILSDTSYMLTYSTQISNPSGAIISDKIGWVQIKGEYIATGGEKFIAIGNFKDNFNTDTILVGGGTISSDYYNAYYYVDDVCVSTDSNDCFTSDGIGNIGNERACNIYPNPTDGLLNIEMNSPLEYSISILDMTSEIIFEEKKISLYSLQIDMSAFASGIYVVQVQTAESVYQKKIVLTKNP